MVKWVYFNIPATGHINPTTPVIAELVARGEDVLYVNTEATRQQVANIGARFVPYPDIPALNQLLAYTSRGNIIQNALMLVGIAEQLLPWTLDLLQTERPQCVLYDSLCGWGKQAAHKLGLPTAAMVTTFVFNWRARPPISLSIALETLLNLIVCLPPYLRIARRMRRNHGVRGVGLLGALMNTGQRTLVFTSADFQPGGRHLDESYRFVGASIAPRPTADDFPYHRLDDRPLVYISLGTINNDNLPFYRACLAAFGSASAQFVLSIGKNTDANALEPIPPNFIVRPFVPQLDILQRAALFITHGGMNSVTEGLYYGVPLIVIPQQAEQATVARRVVACGAGVAVGLNPPYGQVDADTLRHSYQQVMAARHAYQTKAQSIGASLRAGGGYPRAAEELLRFVRGG